MPSNKDQHERPIRDGSAIQSHRYVLAMGRGRTASAVALSAGVPAQAHGSNLAAKRGTESIERKGIRPLELALTNR